jgi:pilus assembly protein TadC
VTLAAEMFASLAGVATAASLAGAWRDRPLTPSPERSESPRERRLDPMVRSSFWSLPVVRIVGLRAERRRRQEADAEVPQLLDLLAAASSSGLAAPLALQRSVQALRGPLGAELRIAVGRIELGERWRDELASLAERLNLPDLSRTVAALARTETLGSPLAATCADMASEVRETRRARTTERARTAPVKMLFPLVFLVLPAFLLLTVVPVLLTTVRSIR